MSTKTAQLQAKKPSTLPLSSRKLTLPESVPILLDTRLVERITAFLFDKGGNDDPYKLSANANKSFQGSIVLGMGFTFDDTNLDATPISEMHRLIEKDPRNAERIFPYIGGEEVNSSPTHAHHRYVINFGEMTEQEARQWPDLMAIVERKVKPGRVALPQKNSWNKTVSTKWWLFGADRKELVRAITQCDRVLVIPLYTKHLSFLFLPSRMVFANKLNVMPFQNYAAFSILQSQVHELFARFFSSTLKDDLQYTPSDCFETFPFPLDYETDPTLETIGQTYYKYRADLMVRHNQGLTTTYNRFHDPEERNPDILKLRHLHDQMDQAVLKAYGWEDINTSCGFALDYLDADPKDLPTAAQDRIASGDLFFPTADEAIAFGSLVSTGKRKLPWRYKWPTATHDEVLARLLELNHQRHLEELGGRKAKGNRPKQGKPETQPKALVIPGMEV
jgi:hypothetical protein